MFAGKAIADIRLSWKSVVGKELSSLFVGKKEEKKFYKNEDRLCDSSCVYSFLHSIL